MTAKQIAALQLVADVQAGCQWARMSSMLADAANPAYRPLHDPHGLVSRFDILDALDEPEKAGLVEFRNDVERGLLVGLTQDGKRCHDINVDWL